MILLKEIDFNIIVLFCFFLNIDKRKRDKFNFDKSKDSEEVN